MKMCKRAAAVLGVVLGLIAPALGESRVSPNDPIQRPLVMSPTNTKPHIKTAKEMVYNALKCKPDVFDVLTTGMYTVVFLRLRDCKDRGGDVAMIFHGTKFYTLAVGQSILPLGYPNGSIAFLVQTPDKTEAYRINQEDGELKVRVSEM